MSSELKAEGRICITQSEADKLAAQLLKYEYNVIGFNDIYYKSRSLDEEIVKNATLRMRQVWYPERKDIIIFDRFEIHSIGSGIFIKKSLLQSDKIYLSAEKSEQAREFLCELGFIETMEIKRTEPTKCYTLNSLMPGCDVYLENIHDIGYIIEIELSSQQTSLTFYHSAFNTIKQYLMNLMSTQDIHFIDGCLFDFVNLTIRSRK